MKRSLNSPIRIKKTVASDRSQSGGFSVVTADVVVTHPAFILGFTEAKFGEPPNYDVKLQQLYFCFYEWGRQLVAYVTASGGDVSRLSPKKDPKRVAMFLQFAFNDKALS